MRKIKRENEKIILLEYRQAKDEEGNEIFVEGFSHEIDSKGLMARRASLLQKIDDLTEEAGELSTLIKEVKLIEKELRPNHE